MARGAAAEQVELEPLVGTTHPEVEWTHPRTGEIKRLAFWSVFSAGASTLLLCTDETGAFRAYRAEECKAVMG